MALVRNRYLVGERIRRFDLGAWLSVSYGKGRGRGRQTYLDFDFELGQQLERQL